MEPTGSISLPAEGQEIQWRDGKLEVPNRPIVCFIEGDGIGPDIWAASRPVFDAAVEKTYGGSRSIAWMEVLAGEKAKDRTGEWLPEATVEAIRHYRCSIKGPLTTPIGGGMRSLNVALRQILDLYACIRPVRYYDGVPSPVKRPEKIDMVIYRENTEDVYAGIEWSQGSSEARQLIQYLGEEFGSKIREDSGIGIKPVSATGSKRLVRKAIRYALSDERESVTLMHKGNIMKYTEGAFKDWGFEVGREEFPDQTITEDDLWDQYNGELPKGRVLIKDRIADSMCQQILLRPDEYDVIATTNLNGDYISDALAAQVGGLGLAPGSNEGDGIALDKVNPSSVILSGVMMLKWLGWGEAGESIERAISATIRQKRVTYDLERQMEGATLLKTSEYGRAIIENLE